MQKKNDAEIPGTDAKERQKNDAAQQPTNDPKLTDPEKTPGSGMFPDSSGDAPSG
ncbi:MAG: hypothetical protein JWR89_4593 [Tardiphaga sp.]|uniref:hypothetical protein n=1 Tax=Tardiphaga sp. TaxID=1926292 RepID=UPI0026132298|nr:hypothetical protein [Tardiphaga sp.]MDB5504691.1 hypothetical protein [Tardiphaga sp.]